MAMTKSNLLLLSALSLLVAAGVAGGCGGTKQVWVPDPDQTAGFGGTGKAGSTSGGGESSMAGETPTEGGSGGVEEEAGTDSEDASGAIELGEQVLGKARHQAAERSMVSS